MAGYDNRPQTVPNTSAQPEKEQEIDLRVVFYDVLRNWWIILLGCIIVAFASYVFIAELYRPRYYAEATFVVTSKDGGSDQVYSNLVVATRLAESISYVMESPVLKQKVAESLEYEKFSGTVTATSIEYTNLIQVGVEADSPKVAFDEMNGIVKYHSIVSKTLLGNAVLDVLKSPTIPTTPVKSMSRLKYMAISTLAAAVVIIAILVVASIMGDEIMTEKDLEKRVECAPLTTIYHERKNISLRSRIRGEKTSMLITNPTTAFRFAETYRLFRTRLEYLMRQKGHKVLMVSSVHENEGKTTTSANIALMLAINKRKTLLIDGDMLKPALFKALDAKIGKGTAIEEFLPTEHDFESLPSMDGIPELKLLLGKTGLRNSTELINSDDMKSLIKKAKEYFDYVIIDTPPIALAGDAECFAEISDCAILVIRQGGSRAARINECIDGLTSSGIDVLGCIFNNVHSIDVFGLSATESSYDVNYKNYGSSYGESSGGYGNYGGYGRQTGGYGSQTGGYGSKGGYGSNRERQQENRGGAKDER